MEQVFVENEAKPPLNSLHSSVLSADSCLSTFLDTRRLRRTTYLRSVTCHLPNGKVTRIVCLVGPSLGFVGGHQNAV